MLLTRKDLYKPGLPGFWQRLKDKKNGLHWRLLIKYINLLNWIDALLIKHGFREYVDDQIHWPESLELIPDESRKILLDYLETSGDEVIFLNFDKDEIEPFISARLKSGTWFLGDPDDIDMWLG